MSPHHHRQSRCRRITSTASRRHGRLSLRRQGFCGMRSEMGVSENLHASIQLGRGLAASNRTIRHPNTCDLHSSTNSSLPPLQILKPLQPVPDQSGKHLTIRHFNIFLLALRCSRWIVLLRVLFNHTPRLYILAQRFVLKIISKRPWTANRDAFFRVVP
jgi:hypothetical protein